MAASASATAARLTSTNRDGQCSGRTSDCKTIERALAPVRVFLLLDAAKQTREQFIKSTKMIFSEKVFYEPSSHERHHFVEHRVFEVLGEMLLVAAQRTVNGGPLQLADLSRVLTPLFAVLMHDLVCTEYPLDFRFQSLMMDFNSRDDNLPLAIELPFAAQVVDAIRLLYSDTTLPHRSVPVVQYQLLKLVATFLLPRALGGTAPQFALDIGVHIIMPMIIPLIDDVLALVPAVVCAGLVNDRLSYAPARDSGPLAIACLKTTPLILSLGHDRGAFSFRMVSSLISNHFFKNDAHVTAEHLEYFSSLVAVSALATRDSRVSHSVPPQEQIEYIVCVLRMLIKFMKAAVTFDIKERIPGRDAAAVGQIVACVESTLYGQYRDVVAARSLSHRRDEFMELGFFCDEARRLLAPYVMPEARPFIPISSHSIDVFCNTPERAQWLVDVILWHGAFTDVIPRAALLLSALAAVQAENVQISLEPLWGHRDFWISLKSAFQSGAIESSDLWHLLVFISQFEEGCRVIWEFELHQFLLLVLEIVSGHYTRAMLYANAPVSHTIRRLDNAVIGLCISLGLNHPAEVQNLDPVVGNRLNAIANACTPLLSPAADQSLFAWYACSLVKPTALKFSLMVNKIIARIDSDAPDSDYACLTIWNLCQSLPVSEIVQWSVKSCMTRCENLARKTSDQTLRDTAKDIIRVLTEIESQSAKLE